MHASGHSAELACQLALTDHPWSLGAVDGLQQQQEPLGDDSKAQLWAMTHGFKWNQSSSPTDAAPAEQLKVISQLQMPLSTFLQVLSTCHKHNQVPGCVEKRADLQVICQPVPLV